MLRLGHRPTRDLRITSHVALVARALGADGIILADIIDNNIKLTVDKVVKTWGGPFYIEMGLPWKETIEKWKEKGGAVVHLTMYGLEIDRVLFEIKEQVKNSDLLLVVGAEKVPGEIFRMADFNVAVSNQPHSEVAALSIFLDRFFEGKELHKEFVGAEKKIIPHSRGKKVVIVSQKNQRKGSC